VLRDRLAGGAHPMLHGESRAELEERLAVTIGKLVEDRSPGRIGQGLEHVTHDDTIGKALLACQEALSAPDREA